MTFSNESELWKALHEGYSITNPAIEGSVCCRHGEVFHVVNGKEEKANFWFTTPEMWSLGTAHNWDDAIPKQGTICRVSNSLLGDWPILVVVHKGPTGYHTSIGTVYKYARPLTKEEGAKYIYQGAN